MNEVKFLGHKISGEGIAISDDRIKAIKNLSPPQNKKELQRLMGFINYVRDYIPNLANEIAPLRDLLKRDTLFQWLGVHDKCLDKIKNAIVQASALKPFDEKKNILIQTDASKNGSGCCLLQDQHPVSYASRSLSETEQRYSQTEKELLAIVFACSKWHSMIYGRNVEIITDHKPLLGIIEKDYHKIPSPRLQRMKLRLEKYKLKLRYLAGKFLYITDTLSRNFEENSVEKEEIEGLNELVHSINVSSEKKKLYQAETENDKILGKLKELIKKGWPVKKRNVPEELKFLWKSKNELFYEDNLIFFNDRIYVPEKLRPSVLKALHIPHLGIEKTKQRARSLVYWPNLNAEIEIMVSNCKICQKFRSANTKEPLISHEIPNEAFAKIGMDIMEVENKDYLIIGDYFSKYLDIIPLNKKTAQAVIDKLLVVFSIYGIPRQIVADNVPFGSYAFREFANKLDIELTTSSPLYPKSNGLAERFVQVAKKMILKCRDDNTCLWFALLEYRNTPIKNSNISPAEIMMGRQTRTFMPGKMVKFKNERMCSRTALVLEHNNKVNAHYYNRNAKAKEGFDKGEKIWVKENNSKNWTPAVIVEKHKTPRSYIVETKNGKQLRRNSIYLRTRK